MIPLLPDLSMAVMERGNVIVHGGIIPLEGLPAFNSPTLFLTFLATLASQRMILRRFLLCRSCF